MQRAQGYNRLSDFDYSFLPASFWRDEIYYKQHDGPCFECGGRTERFNATIGSWECGDCGTNVEDADAGLSGTDRSLSLPFFQEALFS